MWYIGFDDDDDVIPSSVMFWDDIGSGLWKKILVALMTNFMRVQVTFRGIVCTMYVI